MGCFSIFEREVIF